VLLFLPTELVRHEGVTQGHVWALRLPHTKGCLAHARGKGRG
jgi:hypothetical protein